MKMLIQMLFQHVLIENELNELPKMSKQYQQRDQQKIG